MDEPTRLILREDAGRLQVLLQRPGHSIPESHGAPHPFSAPLAAGELEDLRWYLEDYLRAPYGVYQDRGEAIAGRLGEWGERLFAAAFPDGPAREAYAAARESEGCELWLASESPAFLALPWELLRDPRRPAPLALEIAGFNRTSSVAGAAAETPAGERLRVLMVIARPSGPQDVPYQMIARPLLERLEPVNGEVALEVLRPPTFAALKRRLAEARDADEPFHLLHFDGHGSFGDGAVADGDAQRYASQLQGYLIFEQESGEADPVAADALGPVLGDAKVPVLVLNACRSAMLEGGERADAAVATRLLAGGAAATVAMGYSVYAVAAAEFMAAFYEALFAGRTVARAVAAGRRQMQEAADRPSPKGPLPLADWIVPVLYSRREVSFPRLARRERVGRPSLEDALSTLRQQAPGDGVHAEGDIRPEGGVFVGRDREMLELERALRLRRVAVLHGVGGSGKSELAKGFARWLAASGGLDDPGLVFFHSFEPGVATFGLDGVVASIGLRLYGADFARLDPKERRHAVLEALRHARMLLIWDNFETVHSMPAEGGTQPLDGEEREAVRAFLAEVAREARGGVLVTSRSAEDWLGDVHRLAVGGLDAESTDRLADRLLAASPRASARRADAAYPELLELLAGHPLSLRLILPRLADVTDARELDEALRGAAELPALGEGSERLGSLGACVDYSFRHLDPADRKRLPALSLSEGVADVDVLAIFSSLDGAPARFAGADKEAWKATLGACVATGLLTALPLGIYRLHPALPSYLLRLWRQLAGEDFEAEREAARRAMVQAQAHLGTWLLQQIQGGEAETAFAVLTAERRALGRAAGDALAMGMFAEAGFILQSLNDMWDNHGLLEEARAWVDRCREATEEKNGQPPALATAAGGLWLLMVGSQANRLQAAGQLDAAETTYDELRRQLEGSEDEAARRHLATAYHQLGIVAQHRGDLPVAEGWYREALEISKALGNRPEVASSYHQLGIMAHLRGDLEAAAGWYRKSLEIKEALGNRPGMATSYHQLGRVAQRRGDLAAAEGFYRKSLEINEALENRPGIASSYHQLGMVAQDRGDLAVAEAWYHKSLEIYEALADRLHLAASYHQLGRVAQDRGDLATAEGWFRKSLGFSEALGNRPGMALTYGQLGLLAEAREDPATALAWTIRCVALFPDFPHPATVPGPQQLTRLTGVLGMEVLESSWQRLTGALLPGSVRDFVERDLAEPQEGAEPRESDAE